MHPRLRPGLLPFVGKLWLKLGRRKVVLSPLGGAVVVGEGVGRLGGVLGGGGKVLEWLG